MTLPPMKLHLFARERDGLFEEVSGFGYAPVTLKTADWRYGLAEATYPPQTFHFTGAAGVIAGWYVTKNGQPVQSCRCAPIEIKTHGDKLTVELHCTIHALTHSHTN